MPVTGIICEYNPFHRGHKKQLDWVRSRDPEGTIVCLMSGNYVQRGAPAIVDKSYRAAAALRCGADLVLELPITAALSSAEGFADQGVGILGAFCDFLCFGAENAEQDTLTACAEALLSEQFSPVLKTYLDQGLSFPSARQKALEELGVNADILSAPNNILATEYCKAILSQGLSMKPMPIFRQGSYHAQKPDAQNPSATAVRALMLESDVWLDYVPEAARPCFQCAPIHATVYGERAVLGKLRTMSEEEFSQVPYGSEGLWRKLMHCARQQANLEEILQAVKSKRYTRTRLDRMVLCAFLGITRQDLVAPAPYVRILAFNDKGRRLLPQLRATGRFLNAGEPSPHPYQVLENRAGSLYGLFASGIPELPTLEQDRRILYENP